MNETKTHRIWGTTTEEKYTQIEKWSNELGIPVSVYVALAAWVGAKKLAEIHDLTPEKKEE